jgi:hypothetical protein
MQPRAHSSRHSCTDARAGRSDIASLQRAPVLPIAAATMTCHYLLLLLATTSANKLRTRARQFNKWRDARFGCGHQWHYWRCSGQLTDPATGVVIARLEGVEATRALRGDARRGDSEDDVNDDDFLVEPRAFEVRRRYAYADDSDELLEWRARPDAPPRSVARPPPYAATVRLGLRRDGTTVALRSRTEDKALEPRVSTFAVEGFETRVDAYVGTPKKRGLARLFGVGVGGAKTAAARRAQKGLKCRESYVVSRNAVSYRRLGEAPAWAGPGRLCAAELSARRVSRRALRRGSPVARALAAELLEDVDGKQRRVVAEPSEDVDEPPPKRPPPTRGDKWEALFAV